MLSTVSMIEEEIAQHGREHVIVEERNGGSGNNAPPRPQRTQQQPSPPQGGPDVSDMKPLIKRRTDGEMVRGTLTRIDCQTGASAIFNVKAGDRVLRLHAASIERVDFVSYVPSLAGAQLGCGIRKPENLVYVTFRRASDPKSKFDGELIAVDFITPDIELEPEDKP
jgi:hypothetical protein